MLKLETDSNLLDAIKTCYFPWKKKVPVKEKIIDLISSFVKQARPSNITKYSKPHIYRVNTIHTRKRACGWVVSHASGHADSSVSTGVFSLSQSHSPHMSTCHRQNCVPAVHGVRWLPGCELRRGRVLCVCR